METGLIHCVENTYCRHSHGQTCQPISVYYPHKKFSPAIGKNKVKIVWILKRYAEQIYLIC